MYVIIIVTILHTPFVLNYTVYSINYTMYTISSCTYRICRVGSCWQMWSALRRTGRTSVLQRRWRTHSISLWRSSRGLFIPWQSNRHMIAIMENSISTVTTELYISKHIIYRIFQYDFYIHTIFILYVNINTVDNCINYSMSI